MQHTIADAHRLGQLQHNTSKIKIMSSQQYRDVPNASFSADQFAACAVLELAFQDNRVAHNTNTGSVQYLGLVPHRLPRPEAPLHAVGVVVGQREREHPEEQVLHQRHPEAVRVPDLLALVGQQRAQVRAVPQRRGRVVVGRHGVGDQAHLHREEDLRRLGVARQRLHVGVAAQAAEEGVDRRVRELHRRREEGRGGRHLGGQVLHPRLDAADALLDPADLLGRDAGGRAVGEGLQSRSPRHLLTRDADHCPRGGAQGRRGAQLGVDHPQEGPAQEQPDVLALARGAPRAVEKELKAVPRAMHERCVVLHRTGGPHEQRVLVVDVIHRVLVVQVRQHRFINVLSPVLIAALAQGPQQYIPKRAVHEAAGRDLRDHMDDVVLDVRRRRVGVEAHDVVGVQSFGGVAYREAEGVIPDSPDNVQQCTAGAAGGVPTARHYNHLTRSQAIHFDNEVRQQVLHLCVVPFTIRHLGPDLQSLSKYAMSRFDRLYHFWYPDAQVSNHVSEHAMHEGHGGQHAFVCLAFGRSSGRGLIRIQKYRLEGGGLPYGVRHCGRTQIGHVHDHTKPANMTTSCSKRPYGYETHGASRRLTKRVGRRTGKAGGKGSGKWLLARDLVRTCPELHCTQRPTNTPIAHGTTCLGCVHRTSEIFSAPNIYTGTLYLPPPHVHPPPKGRRFPPTPGGTVTK